jgi:signal peptidase I
VLKWIAAVVKLGDKVNLDRGVAPAVGVVKEPYSDGCDRPECDFPKEVTIAPGTYFMAGDNRGASDDSRFWGPVPRAWILGRVERCHALYFACSPVR